MVLRYVIKVFPQVKKNLNQYKKILGTSLDNELKTQALASINAKKFHCLGGSIYALYPDVNFHSTIEFITSLQTISDYLDNLCDRTDIKDKNSFWQLHLSLSDALEPSSTYNDYYMYYPYKEDTYLQYLVGICKSSLSNLYSYRKAIPYIKKYIELYSHLQTYKHLDICVREQYMKNWGEKYLKSYPQISLWEFSAATGSTLGIFAMYAAAHNPLLSDEEFECIHNAYFPWICGLHILLDYYNDIKVCEERIIFFAKKSLKMCTKLKYPLFHTTVVKGLLAMYLSDSKAFLCHNKKTSFNILNAMESDTKMYFRLCKLLRTVGVL
ncbi:UNVERIFIED_CONTAM: tetraprenyl-beta-curcumene synthase [Acetivibrio alkalicellulosi]